MVELVKSPSMRVLSKGCLALWLVISLVFTALLFAVGAQAQGTNAPDGTAETPIGEAAAESGAPPGEAPSVVEQAPPAVEEAPPAVEEAPPAVEEAPPAVEEAPPVVEEAPPAVPVAEAPPVVEQAPPVVEEAPSVIEKKPAEQTTGEAAAETGSEATQGSGEDSQVPAGASGLTHKEATAEVAPEISIAATTYAGPAAVSEISTSPVQGQLPLAMRPQTTRSAGQMSCVRASIPAGYAGGWLGILASSSTSNIPFTAADASSTTITAGAPAGGLGNGSTIENHPSSPGSGSGGGGGGSAAGSGSGSASSASSTLVDVLLQAAPRAMRRLRLAQPSWRTSFFVLIPERPD